MGLHKMLRLHIYQPVKHSFGCGATLLLMGQFVTDGHFDGNKVA